MLLGLLSTSSTIYLLTHAHLQTCTTVSPNSPATTVLHLVPREVGVILDNLVETHDCLM
jgi:hypothetical protein